MIENGCFIAVITFNSTNVLRYLGEWIKGEDTSFHTFKTGAGILGPELCRGFNVSEEAMGMWLLS